VSGRVLNVMQESETVVSPSMQILEIGDPMDIEIGAEILSRDSVAIRPGDSVEIMRKCHMRKCQINNYRISLAAGSLMVWWGHAQGTVAGGLAGFGFEAGDLPLYLAGGGPAFCVRGAGMRGVPHVHADV
jgi:hypothetical protein